LAAQQTTVTTVSDQNWRNIVARIQGWGFKVVEWDSPYGKNNGIPDWHNDNPDAHLNHHFVCSLNPAQSYINGLVGMLAGGYGETPGPVVNWFADVNGVAYLIATGPANHSGRGDSSVLARVRQDLAPNTTHPANNDFTGNAYYSGTESQHPGDSTPWPDALLDVMVAISAAEHIEFGHSANRTIDHYEHTNRKVDMSFMGGPNGSGSDEFRRRVAARMAGDTPTPTNPGTDWIMTLPGAPATFDEAVDLIVNRIVAVLGKDPASVQHSINIGTNNEGHRLNADGTGTFQGK
jgi:hypothetical protein